MRQQASVESVPIAWLWGGSVLVLVWLYGPGSVEPGRALRELALVPCALILFGVVALRSRLRPNAVLVSLLGFASASAAAGIVLAPDRERLLVLRDAMVLVAPWLVCVSAAMLVREDERRIDGAIEKAAVIALCGVGAVGLLQAWFGWSGFVEMRPPASTFVNRNVAAQTLVLLVPLAAAMLLHARTRWWRWIAGISTCVGLAFALATRSRGAWLGLLAGATVACIVWFGSRRDYLRVPSTAALLPVCLVASLTGLIPVHEGDRLLPSVATRLTTLANPTAGSGAVRKALWVNTGVLTASTPWLGVGPGRFVVEYPRFQTARLPTPVFGLDYQPRHPHNDWLEYAAELGWPAALGLLFACGASVVLCGRSGDDESLESGVRRAGRAAAVAGTLVHSLVSFPLHSPVSAFLAWLIIGRSWSVLARPTEAGPRVRKAVGVFAVLLAAATLIPAVRETRFRACVASALRSLERADCDGASKSIRNAGRPPWHRGARGLAAMIVFECDADRQSSLQILERALEVLPHQLNLLMAVGGRRLKAGDLDGAESAYGHATAVAPNLARAWAGLAMTQAVRGDRSSAAESCRTALELDANLGPAREFCEANRLIEP